MKETRTKDLKAFADKLADEQPLSEIEIQKTMENLGLVYTDDEIERLNRVLLALHPLSAKIKEDTRLNKEITH